MEVQVPTLVCLRCAHRWVPRKPEVMLCPKCKTPYWNKKRDGEKKI